MPSKPGEFSPSRIAFRRERRHPLIPALPAEGGEIEQGHKQQEDKEREQGDNDDDQQALDVMLQKYKARGDEECDDEQ